MRKILSIILILVFSMSLTACKESLDSSSTVNEISSKTSESSLVSKTSEEYTEDAINLAKSTKLTESFKDKEFVKDGIGEVTLTENG